MPAQLAQMECLWSFLQRAGLTKNCSIFGSISTFYDHPLLLLVDGHSSHYCRDTTKLAAEGVIVFTIPPHSSHIIQPLDKGLYGQLKVAWKQIYHYYLIENPGISIGKHNFSRLLSKAWLSPKNAIPCFKATGIYPPNRNVIKLVKDAPTLSGKHGIAFIPLYTPQPASQSTQNKKSHVPTEDSTSEPANSSIIDGFSAAAIYKSAISGLLKIPTPPKPTKVPEHSLFSSFNKC